MKIHQLKTLISEIPSDYDDDEVEVFIGDESYSMTFQTRLIGCFGTGIALASEELNEAVGDLEEAARADGYDTGFDQGVEDTEER
jgi:hypothetical protein